MTDCDRLRADAPGLAALRSDDPERVAAWSHANGCPGCASALREAERLQALIAGCEPAPLPVGATERASRAIVAELRREARRRALGSIVAICASVLLFVGFARSRSRSTEDWAMAAVLAALAIALAAFARRRPLLVVGVTVLAALAAGLAFGQTPLAGAPGVHCLATELASAAVVVGAVWLALRKGTTSPARSAIAAAAAAGALAGDAALQVTCGAQDEVPHLLAFHVGGVLLAAAAASLLWRAAQRVAARPIAEAQGSASTNEAVLAHPSRIGSSTQHSRAEHEDPQRRRGRPRGPPPSRLARRDPRVEEQRPGEPRRGAATSARNDRAVGCGPKARWPTSGREERARRAVRRARSRRGGRRRSRSRGAGRGRSTSLSR